MKELGRKLKYGTNAEKPIIFIYSAPMYMARYVSEFKSVLKDYLEVFDIYYTDDENKAKRHFYTREFPDIIPYVVIIDPKKKKAIKSSKGLSELNGNSNNYYYEKYRELIFMSHIKKDLNKLIDKYLDGELHHFY
jgi:hypothetical protein